METYTETSVVQEKVVKIYLNAVSKLCHTIIKTYKNEGAYDRKAY